jgi:hypothetical protein
MNRFFDHFRGGDDRGVQFRAAPSDLQGQTRKIDDTSGAAVTTQIVRRSHENAIHRAALGTDSANQTFRVIDRETGDAEAFFPLGLLLADVDTAYGAIAGAALASDATRQIVAVEAAITRGYPQGKLGIFIMLGEGFPPQIVGDDPIAHGNPQRLKHRDNRSIDIGQPTFHEFLLPWEDRSPKGSRFRKMAFADLAPPHPIYSIFGL